LPTIFEACEVTKASFGRHETMLQLIVFYFYFETLDLGVKEALKPEDNIDLDPQEAQIFRYRTSIL
jgi:hypothetical protein